MDPSSFNVDLESSTSYHLSGNGSYLKRSDSKNLLLLPEEIWLEQTKVNQIRRNADKCLMFRNGYQKALLTGLKPCGGYRWYTGNILRYVAGKKSKIRLVVFISQDNQMIEIFKPLGRAEKTTGKEKSLPEAFKSSRMKFHPVTRQR
jgi:hypothetical protein